jgi:hypothetical protein
MIEMIKITKHKNGVGIIPVDHERSQIEDAREAVLVTFKPIDDWDRKNGSSGFYHPVHHILDALKPILLEMDEAYVAANTPPAPDPDVELTEEVKE